MKYNYIIIEDEKGSYENLKTALKPKTKYIHKGFATNVKDGVDSVLEHRPDLIFLDVELGGESGFDVIKELKNSYYEVPSVIMVTAHDVYAKSAVNHQVIYFLSKPVCSTELSKALQIFEKKYANKDEQMFIRSKRGLELIRYDEIICIKASSGYTDIVLICGRCLSIPKTLKYFETILNNNFFQINRGCIINITKIKEIKLTEREIYLKSGDNTEMVKLGKNYIQKLRTRLKI